MLDKFMNVKRCKSFDAFVQNCCLWEVKIVQSILSTSCNCPEFMLHYVCKHVLVALIEQNVISVPEEFSTKELIEEKKKPGRPSKAKSALNT